jgi:hypothetical protein
MDGQADCMGSGRVVSKDESSDWKVVSPVEYQTGWQVVSRIDEQSDCKEDRGPDTAKTLFRKFETNIPRKGTARPLSPNSFVHVFVSDLYIPTFGLPILLHENRWTDRGNI